MSGYHPLNKIREGLVDALGEIASGAYIDFDSENYPHLYRDVPQPSGDVFHELLGYGWLTPNCGGRGFRLSDEGLRAYFRATDELQGQMERPCKTFNPNPGNEHPENAARRLGWTPPEHRA